VLMNAPLFQDMRHVQLKLRRGCSLVKVPQELDESPVAFRQEFHSCTSVHILCAAA